MSWVAVGTAAVGTAGKLVAGNGSGGGAAPSAIPAGDFYGGGTGDFNIGAKDAPAISQKTIWVIVAAIVGVFLIWRATAKK
jgi:hypothetical protein